MYVCVCNAYTEREIRAMARAGVRSVEEAYRRLGSEPICRRCLITAQQLIDDGQARTCAAGGVLAMGSAA